MRRRSCCAPQSVSVAVRGSVFVDPPSRDRPGVRVHVDASDDRDLARRRTRLGERPHRRQPRLGRSCQGRPPTDRDLVVGQRTGRKRRTRREATDPASDHSSREARGRARSGRAAAPPSAANASRRYSAREPSSWRARTNSATMSGDRSATCAWSSEAAANAPKRCHAFHIARPSAATARGAATRPLLDPPRRARARRHYADPRRYLSAGAGHGPGVFPHPPGPLSV